MISDQLKQFGRSLVFPVWLIYFTDVFEATVRFL